MSISHPCVKQVPGNGGLPRLIISTDLAEAEVYLHGAHLTHFQPRGHKPILFMSASSLFEPGKPIRGGVPVIFPWFGPHPTDKTLPLHGLVRTRTWQFISAARSDAEAVVLDFAISSDETMRAAWPHEFELEYSIAIGRRLTLTLAARNCGAEPITCETALHTYLAVGDVRQCRIHGLAGAGYLDKTDGMSRKTQGETALTLTGETDRVYGRHRGRCEVADPVLGRRLAVEKENSRTTVVWNPWIAKAKAMADFGDEEWPAMLCIESANAGSDALHLLPGQGQAMRATIEIL